MARVFSSPGVYRREIDLSEILVPTGISNGGTVIISKKGPVNRPVLVTNDKEFIETFGAPIFTSGTDVLSNNGKMIPEYGYGAYAALEFLKESGSLYVVREFTSGSDTYAGVKFASNNTITSISAGISGVPYEKGDRLDTPDYISIIENYGDASAPGSNAFNIAYVGPGTDGNNFAVTIEPFSLSAGWKFSYDEFPPSAHAVSGNDLTNDEIEQWYPIASQIFKINVYAKSDGREWDSYFRNEDERTAGTLYVSPVETWYGSLKENLKDSDGNDLNITNIVNGNSPYIYVKKGLGVTANHFSYIDDSDDLPDARDTNEITYVKYITSAVGTFGKLSGGKSTQVNGLNTTAGWTVFEDRENVPVSILIGTSPKTAYKQVVARIAATRQDCIAVNQTGELNHDKVEQIIEQELYGYKNPSYNALYCGYSKIYDKYNDKHVWIPNSIFGSAVMARVDRFANPWDAPAGINRAILPVLEQRKIWSSDEIGRLYDRNINAIKFTRGTGDVIWGQKTSQMKKSALDRINVRRNLLFIEGNVEIALLPFIFENNTSKTRLRVFVLLDEFLSGVQAGGGLTNYRVVCNESNNPSAIIDANRMNVDIYVQPARSIEFIQLTTVVTRTGVSIESIII